MGSGIFYSGRNGLRTALNTTISPLPGGRGMPGTPRFRLRPARRDLGTPQSCFCPARRDLGNATILPLPGEARPRARHNPASARRGATSGRHNPSSTRRGATSGRHNPSSTRRGATSGTPQPCFCPARRDLGNATILLLPGGRRSKLARDLARSGSKSVNSMVSGIPRLQSLLPAPP